LADKRKQSGVSFCPRRKKKGGEKLLGFSREGGSKTKNMKGLTVRGGEKGEIIYLARIKNKRDVWAQLFEVKCKRGVGSWVGGVKIHSDILIRHFG